MLGVPTRCEVALRPTLVLNPVTDRDFAACAERLVDDGVVALEEFEAGLRVQYPHATVHARELAGEPITIWYVYRDGQWTNPRDDDP